MRVSFNTPVSSNQIHNNDGYGVATKEILSSLTRLGYDVTENDADADIGLVFNQPQHARWYGNQYKIILLPWESTLMMSGWAEVLNQADEVWSPSPLIGEWYKEYNGITTPIYTYEHGVDAAWEPKPREVNGPLRFLHVGGEAYRKGLPETLKAFRAAFNESNDVALTVKLGMHGFNVEHGNIETITGKLPFAEQVALHHDRHVFVYPSWGEGFGFNPIQAMATGMPTIVTGAWAPYRRYIDERLDVTSCLTDSPWSDVHPGKMYQPNIDDLIDKMRYAVSNYEDVHIKAQETAPLIHEAYAWDAITKKTFEALEDRL